MELALAGIFIGLFFNAAFSALVAWIAVQRGRRALSFFLLGFLVSFVIALIVVLILPNLNSEAQSGSREDSRTGGGFRECPSCAENIKKHAVVCRFCGRDVSPVEDSKESALRNWCPRCKVESIGEEGQLCEICGLATHVWD
jgi:hypothetical protein